MAAELAALSAWRVIDQGDRVGAIIFNDTRIIQARPARSERSLMAILSKLSEMNRELRVDGDEQSRPEQLPAALEIAERMMSHDSLLVIISDFDGWNAKALGSVKRLAQHNDLIAGLVFDPLEQDITPAANLVVSDGRFQLQLDPHKQDLGGRFEAGFHSALDDLQVELRKHGMPVLPLNTVEPVFEQLRHQLGPH
jgi:uncharacterized protein (DUF58 family)